MTGLEPLDFLLEANLEPPYTPPQGGDVQGFNFQRANLHPWLLEELLRYMLEYMFKGSPGVLEGDNAAGLVEFGLARFTRPVKGVGLGALIDEPLAILAFGRHHESVSWQCQPSLGQCIPPSFHGRADLGRLAALTILQAFNSPTPLSKVFRFTHESCISHKFGRVAWVSRCPGKGVDFTAFRLSEDHRPCSQITISPPTPKHFISWLLNPSEAPICLPPSMVGPDVILLLALSNGDGMDELVDTTFLWVALQCVQHATWYREELPEAISTVNVWRYGSSLLTSEKH